MVHLIIQLFLLSCIFLKQLNTCVKAKPVFLNTYSVLHMSFQTVYKLGYLGNYDPIFYRLGKFIDLVQFSRSVVTNPCSPMDCSTPVFPVLHHLPELTQTHVHWVRDAIQPSNPKDFYVT